MTINHPINTSFSGHQLTFHHYPTPIFIIPKSVTMITADDWASEALAKSSLFIERKKFSNQSHRFYLVITEILWR